jgi:DNA repair protein RecO (recombination protein O)
MLQCGVGILKFWHSETISIMLQKTRGIVLHSLKYGETGMIATVYTEQFGRISFLIQGMRSKKSTVKVNHLQPFFLVELEVYYKPGRDLHRIKELKNSYPFSSIPFEITKSTQAIFLAEILNKVLREEESHPELFEFLYYSIQVLDLLNEGVANFHLIFLAQLSRYLGFGPTNNFSDEMPYYDLMAGIFVSMPPSHVHFLKREESSVFSLLLSISYQKVGECKIDQAIRNILPERILEYYSLHLGGKLKIKSLDILHEILH